MIPQELFTLMTRAEYNSKRRVMIETEDEETYDAEFVFELYDEDEEN